MKIIKACVTVLVLSSVGSGLAMNNNENHCGISQQRKESFVQQRLLVSVQQRQQRKLEKQKQHNLADKNHRSYIK